jgi:D-alanyl-D-alanine carboxypeptidase
MILSWLLNLIAILFFAGGSLPAQINTAAIMSPRPEAAVLNLGAEKSAALMAGDRVFLWRENADEPQPIASITKLMTALVFLDDNPGWNSIYKIGPEDNVAGGKLNLFLGDRVKVKDLFYTSLVASDNGATLALVHATGLSESEFVKKMNDKAASLGLSRTSFVDPAGLGDENLSTAEEVDRLAQAALSRPEIRGATTRAAYEFTTLDGKNEKIESTDYLLLTDGPSALTVLGGKTGYTDKAGYCFVGWFKDKSGREVIAAVLNAGGKNDRFVAARDLAAWVFGSFKW